MILTFADVDDILLCAPMSVARVSDEIGLGLGGLEANGSFGRLQHSHTSRLPLERNSTEQNDTILMFVGCMCASHYT